MCYVMAVLYNRAVCYVMGQCVLCNGAVCVT